MGVDYIGLDFQKGSSRSVAMNPVYAGTLPDRAPKGYSDANTHSYALVGVFADEMAQNIITRTVMFKLDVIQMNGNEPPTLLRNLRATIDPDLRRGVKVWKGIGIGSPSDIGRYKDYDDCVDAFVFYLGNGLDATVVAQMYSGDRPFLVGNVKPGDTFQAAVLGHPRFMGFDLDTAFELASGVKDVALIRRFIEVKNEEFATA